MPIPTIPPILTEADWNKHKGVIAKMAGETGIGAAMKSFKAAFDRVEWIHFSVKQSYKNIAEIDAQQKAVMAEGSKIEPIRKELFKLRDVAKAAEEKFKKSKLIPSTSTQQVQKIQKAAEDFALTMKSMDSVLKEFESSRAKVTNRENITKAAVVSYLGKVEAGIKRVTAKPTGDEFASFWKEEIRGMGAAISKTPTLAPTFSPVWQKLSAQSYLPGSAATPQVVKAKLAEVQKALNDVKKVTG